MRFRGSVNLNRFAELYALVVQYNGHWTEQPDEEHGVVVFEVEVCENVDAFKAELCETFDCPVENGLTLWQKIKRFLKLEGDTCDRCC